MNKKLRICHIGWAMSPHTARWVKWFADRGHDSRLITDQGEIEGVKTYLIPQNFGVDTRPRWKRYMRLSFNIWRIQKMKYPLQRILWLRNLINEINPDIVHSHPLWYPGNLGVWVKAKNFVVTVMNGDVLYHHSKDASLSHHLMVMYAMRKAKLITGVSQTLLNAAQKHGASEEKTYVIRRGVNLSLFNSHRDKDEVKKQLVLKSKYIVLSPRYLAPVGNVSTLIRAVPLIVEKIPNIKFVFIFPQSGDSRSLELKALGRELGVLKYLEFIGKVPHEQVPLYHTAADLMVSIPLEDSGPIAMQEAMACGAVPVMSDLPCVREWIEHDKNGILIPAKDFKRLANEIVGLLENDEKRSSFVEKNLTLIHEKGDQEKWMEKVEDLYYSLINKKGI